MRLKRLALTAAGGGLVLVGLAAPSQAGLTTFCDGVAENVTVPGDLVVGAGDSCDLTNVVIQGNATVRADANLTLTDSTVEGALRVNSNGFASTVETEVQGATRLNEAFGVYSEASSHDANIVASDSQFFYSLDSAHNRNVNSTNVEVFIESGWVTKNVRSEGGLLTDLYDTVVEGDLSVTGTELGSVVCFSEIDGDTAYADNAGVVQLGGTAPVSDCGFNAFGGNVALTGNTAESSITGNVIRGDLTCTDNSPAPAVNDNRIRGEENCDTAAAASKFGAARGAFGSAGDEVEKRKTEVREQIEDRSGEATDAAEEAGPAFE